MLQSHILVGGPRAPPECSQRASTPSRSGQPAFAVYGIARPLVLGRIFAAAPAVRFAEFTASPRWTATSSTRHDLDRGTSCARGSSWRTASLTHVCPDEFSPRPSLSHWLYSVVQQLTVSVPPATAIGRTAQPHSEPPTAGLARGRAVSSLIFRLHCTCSSVEPAVAYSGCELVSELGITAVADTARALYQLCLFYACSFHSVVSARHDELWRSLPGICHFRTHVGCQ